MLALTRDGTIECALAARASFRRMFRSACVTFNVSAKVDIQIAQASYCLLDGKHAVMNDEFVTVNKQSHFWQISLVRGTTKNILKEDLSPPPLERRRESHLQLAEATNRRSSGSSAT
jgi:hypothetical protein